eukprot:scaffold358_cov256-Pinguiococcus_pyrenoidosus.AAC.24
MDLLARLERRVLLCASHDAAGWLEADAEVLAQRLYDLRLLLGEVVQQALALADQRDEAPARVVVLGMAPGVLRQVLDPLGHGRHLKLRRAAVRLVPLVLARGLRHRHLVADPAGRRIAHGRLAVVQRLHGLDLLRREQFLHLVFQGAQHLQLVAEQPIDVQAVWQAGQRVCDSHRRGRLGLLTRRARALRRTEAFPRCGIHAPHRQARRGEGSAPCEKKHIDTKLCCASHAGEPRRTDRQKRCRTREVRHLNFPSIAQRTRKAVS